MTTDPQKPQPDSKFFDQDPEVLCTPDVAREALKRLDAIVMRQRKARGELADKTKG